MNVPTITMDREEAKRKLKAFRADRHKDAEAIYRQAAEAYEHLANGTVLLQLSQAFRQAGADDRGRPRIAICRADRKECGFEYSTNERRLRFWAGPFYSSWGTPTQQVRDSKTLMIHVPVEQWPKSQMGFALVPMLPADVRPKQGQLKDWHILWEVDQWHDRPRHLTPPRDPLLLKHLGGDLWAVLAQWDLTDIEQAILANTQL